MEVRLASVKCLLEIFKKEKSFENVIDFYSKKVNNQNALISLVSGVVKQKLTLDFLIEKISSRKKISPPVRNILRLAIYEISYQHKPDYATTNSYVDIAKKYDKKSSSFVNAVLRNFVRNVHEIKLPYIEEDTVYGVSIIYSHPEWLVKRWINHYGPSLTLGICGYNNLPPKLSVRINLLKTTKEQVELLFKENDIEFKQSPICDECLILKTSLNISKIPGFHEGLWVVQGETSSLVAKVLDPQPRENILDLCAAPGSKTTHIASLMNDSGCITAVDISEKRIAKISENSARLGISCIKAVTADATTFTGEDKFDRILVDAPCSNTGVLQKRPDARWNKTIDDIKSLSELQLKILNNAARLLKQGGVIVYSTCSIEPEENQEVIDKFLQENQNFSLDKTSGYINFLKDKNIEQVQILQSQLDADGFFITRLIKS